MGTEMETYGAPSMNNKPNSLSPFAFYVISNCNAY